MLSERSEKFEKMHQKLTKEFDEYKKTVTDQQNSSLLRDQANAEIIDKLTNEVDLANKTIQELE